MEKVEIYRKSRSGKILGGLIIIAIGIALLLKKLGVAIPEWLFTWEMVLILIGIYSGAKHRFRYFSWILLVMIGILFLMDDIIPSISISQFVWPATIIIAGLFTIFFNPHGLGRHHPRNWKSPWNRGEHSQQETLSEEDFVESISVFGSSKKSILSKNLKGGEIAAIIGGAEIDLSQADINDKIVLEVLTVLGAVKIIIPPQWEVKSEVVVVFGAIDDKRPLYEHTINSNKVLVLKGAAVLGGIDIKSTK